MLFPKEPKLGLVIGTHGTPAYIHLHLETAKRLYPDVPVLVHNDGSNKVVELDEVCLQYGADFDMEHGSMGHYGGDLTAFVKGLLWAKRHGVELLVKMSRRFVPLRDWRRELIDLAMEGQYPTYSSYCEGCKFLFRTECIALHVDSWYGMWPVIWDTCTLGTDIGLLEAYFHHLAKEVKSKLDERKGSYVYWPLLGTSRFRKMPDHLWHSSCSLADYYNRSVELGLSYSEQDFSC